jgi:paraquat-inducible protein B
METPTVKKKKGISPIWILPIIALMIGGWLLYDSYKNAGIDIVVHFPDAEGITIGKSEVIYKGISIGVVRDITVDPKVSSIALHIEIKKIAAHGIVKDTKFWIVKPEVSAGKIRGLETLLTGSYIAVQRGISTEPCSEFIGLAEPPPIPADAPGLHIKLAANELGSIQRGTMLYYKNIEVGSVQNYHLNESGSGVIINAYIDPQHKHLIKTKTRFWNSSGINFKGGLSGFKFRMESMASLIYGGISLYTPSYQIDSPPAQNERTFHLYEDYDDAEFGLNMTLRLPTAQGIEAGVTKVMYRGFAAGIVTSIDFNDEKHIVTAHISIDPKAEFILRDGTRFWVVEPEVSINRVRNLDTLIKGIYIAFEPGDGNYKDYFDVQKAPFTDKILPAGKTFTITSDDSSSIQIAAPVLYRKLKVGEITDFHLRADGDKIRGEILIYQKYAHLVQVNSIFWKVGGVKLKADLNGIDIESGTLDTLLTGGLSFTNPPDDTAAVAKELQNFTVYNSYDDATKLIPALHKPGIRIKLKAASAKDFSVGSPILYKYIEVGKVTGFELEESGNNVLIDLFISQKYANLLQPTSIFYNTSNILIKGDLSGIKIKTGSFKSMLTGGIAFFTPESDKSDKSKISENQQYILYDNLEDAQNIDKQLISITFSDPNGLKEELKVRYHGIIIGSIAKLNFNAAMDAVICRVLIDKSAGKLFTSDARIWLVKPEVSLSGINNLETVIGGPFITILPGTGDLTEHFTALNHPPSITKAETGLNIVLEADRLSSLKKGSPLYYRQVEVGQVTGFELASTAQKVWIHVNIKPPYNRLIYSNTKFWTSSGIRLDAGLFSGVQIATESVESLVAGGISMATPEAEEMGNKALQNQHFILNEEAKECWSKWHPEIDLRPAE